MLLSEFRKLTATLRGDAEIEIEGEPLDSIVLECSSDTEQRLSLSVQFLGEKEQIEVESSGCELLYNCPADDESEDDEDGGDADDEDGGDADDW